MKLKEVKHQEEYNFLMIFENGEILFSNLESLISKYVKPQDLRTASVSKEWGCLEFKNGEVDIEPKTLYHYTKKSIN